MSPKLAEKTIIIVSDELNMRIFLCNILGSCGYAPVDAGSRKEGMQKIKTEKPALIILDVMMPKESGVQMYRELMDDEELKSIPVILLSTIDKKTFSYYHKFRSASLDNDFFKPGAYLEKPFEANTLISLVNGMVSSGEGRIADPVSESTRKKTGLF